MSSQFFKYYGGKKNMLQHILPLIPAHKAYIEPFCGGASVFFAKQLCKVNIINDINENVINFYRVCSGQTHVAELLELVDCSLHSKSMHDEATEIYKNGSGHSPAQRAWALWFSANFSFSGILGGTFARSIDVSNNSAKNQFVTMRSKKADFRNLLHKIENATIECEPAIMLMRREPYNIAEMFAYVDPPYFNSDCGHYRGYSEADFMDLLTFLATEFKGRFLLSSYPSQILAEFSEKYAWETKEITQKMSVSGKGTQGKTKVEVITFNYELPQNKLF